MSSQDRGVPSRETENVATQSQEGFAVLRECLIGGDAQQSRQERRLRRRSLAISTLLQAVVVLTIVAIPFFGKVERIAMADYTPIPPYHPYGGVARERTVTLAPRVGEKPTMCFLCPPAHPRNPSSGGNQRPSDGLDSSGENDAMGENTGGPCPGCINIVGNTQVPQPPPGTDKPAIVHVTHLDPAMLIERIEPAYPPLTRQIRRNGRVELHAIISTDGRIESLEVVSGDALFYQSAIDAVRRWRYRPTILNGLPVKVDTYITVIYTMQG